MAILLNSKPGTLVALTDPAAQGILPLVTADPAITFRDRRALITRLAVAQETSHQFTHMIGGDLYLYVFGDRPGQMVLSGLAAAFDCDQPGDPEHGFEKMLKWYKENRLSKRRDPVTVMVGRTPLTGFVAGMSGGVFDHKLYLFQFDLTMVLLPEKD